MPGVQSEITSSPLIPFVLPQVLTSGMRMGMGRLFQVTAAAATDTTITHNLGRIPHFTIILDSGTTFTPKIARSSVTPWSISTVTIQFQNAVSNAWVWVV